MTSKQNATDPEPRLKPATPNAQPDEDARAVGEARFASPIESVGPVNPDAASEQPFVDLPDAETAKDAETR